MAPALGNRHASQDSSQETCQTVVANDAVDVAMTQGLLIAQFSQDLALLQFLSGCDAAETPPETPNYLTNCPRHRYLVIPGSP